MAAQGDAHRYLPEDERQIPLAVKYADSLILDAIEAEFAVTRTAAAIILAAVEAHQTGRPVAYSRSKDFYSRARYRHPLISSYTAVVRAVDLLADLSLINHFRQVRGGMGWQSAFSAKDHLVAGVQRLLIGGPRLRLVAPRTLTILRDAEGMDKSYTETREIARQERRTAAFNECFTSADVQLVGEAPSPFNLASPMARIYNVDFRNGGRFYGSGRNVQNLPAEDRRRLLIDGAPVVELDYSAFHPSLLYAKVGAVPPTDCYDIDGWPRDLVKVGLLVLINAPTWPSARWAIAFHGQMAALGKFGSDAEAARLIADIKRVHKPIAHLFHTAAGLRLMRTDSDLADAIMKELIIDKGIVALSIHDSFLVPAANRADLEVAMEAAPGRLGLPRLRFKAA